MKLLFIAMIGLVGILFGEDSHKTNDKIKMYTDVFPPDAMFVENKLSGLSVEIIDALLKEINSSQTINDIVLTSWARAYNIAQVGKNIMIFSTVRHRLREPLFKWAGPLFSVTPGFIALKSKNIKINKTSDINKYKVGTLKKEIGHMVLLKNGIKASNISLLRGDIIKNGFIRMEKNKIDILSYYSAEFAFYNAKALGFDMSKYEVIHRLKKRETYFAFSKNTSDKIVSKWQKGLDNLKKNGSHSAILKKYSLEK